MHCSQKRYLAHFKARITPCICAHSRVLNSRTNPDPFVGIVGSQRCDDEAAETCRESGARSRFPFLVLTRDN